MLGTPVEASHEPHDATFSAAALGHAMARTARVLLSTASGTTTEAGQPSSDVNVASSSGAFAADPLFNSAAAARAAASAAEAVAAMHEAARRCAELKGASVDAAAEAAVCESRVQAAAERKALLEAQLGEVENEASALEVEHDACQKMLEQRQAAQQADERALAEAMAQIDAERTEARRALSEAIRRLTSARGEAQRLEAELAANTRRAHLLSGGGEVQRDESASRTQQDETVAHLLSERSRLALGHAKDRVAQAQAALQALQADEVAREAERRRRSHAKQRSHGRNAELAAAGTLMATDDLPGMQARWKESVDAAVIHQHLGEAHAMREVAEKARAAAEKRSAQLSAEAMQAEKAWAGSRERASKCMHAAHAASRAALVAMEHACAHDGASLAATEHAAELDEPEWLLHACAHDGASLDEPEWLSRAAQEVSVVVSAAPEVSHRSAEEEFRRKAHHEFRHTAGREAHHEFRHKAHHAGPPLPPPRPPHPETSPEASPEGSPETPAATAAEFRHPETSPEASPETPAATAAEFRHPETSPEGSPETPAATAAEFRHTEAEEGHAGAESSAHLGAHELGLHARLSCAYAEAERWRHTAEELELLREVVLVDVHKSEQQAVGNSSLRARMGQLSDDVAALPAVLRATAGVALVGVGFVTMGPAAGTALGTALMGAVGAAGAATYAQLMASSGDAPGTAPGIGPAAAEEPLHSRDTAVTPEPLALEEAIAMVEDVPESDASDAGGEGAARPVRVPVRVNKGLGVKLRLDGCLGDLTRGDLVRVHVGFI
eukprot:jgi/Chrpa1/6086/Chrysochromulina_OHIO_Genome00011620-RA